MINFVCDKCEKNLEVDDELAGKKVECPFCADINLVPSRQVARSATAKAANKGPSGSGGQARSSGSPSDRATDMGLPPDSGPEQHVLTVHPAMLRARPIRGGLVWLMILSGITLAVFVPALGWIGGGLIASAGALWLLVWWVQTRTVALILTNKRTTLRRGLLSRQTREVLHDRVQDIQITQTFLQRIWNVGRLGVSSSGEAGIEIEAADLPDPVGIRQIIDAYRNV